MASAMTPEPMVAIVRCSRGDIARSIARALRAVPARTYRPQATALPTRKKRPVVVITAEAKPASSRAARSSSGE